MDDLELEARLRTRLHRRFDDASIPSALVSNVRHSLATQPRRVGFAIRVRPIRLGWAAVAAAIVIGVAAIGIGRSLGPAGPGPGTTPSPSATAAPARWFIVLPPDGTVVAKPDTVLAIEVLSARLRALGFGFFSSMADYGIEFSLSNGDPPDEKIRAVLGATGDVRVVPLPLGDYGPGKLEATVGAPLPKDEPALFGWEGIAAAATDPVVASPDLSIALKPAAAQAFSDYTSAHVGETFAIVVDGRVALLPRVTDAIASGQLTLSSAGDPSFRATAAILAGGMLPEAWRGASVPVIVSRDTAVAAALATTRGGTVRDASPSVEQAASGGVLRAVWRIAVYQPDCPDTGSCPTSDLLVRVDAVTGTVIDVGPMGQ